MKTFEQIYEENYSLVMKRINSKIHDRCLSEELTNDVFMKVHNNLNKYDESLSSMSTWIMTIVNNSIIDYWRKRKLDTTPLVVEDDNDSPLDILNLKNYAVTSVETDFINEESHQLFVDRLNSLNEKYAVVAKEYFLTNKTYEEIANEMNISLTAIKVRIHRAKKQLINKLKK